MSTNHNSKAKDFFLQIGIVAALYTSVTSFLVFAFGVIDYVFPDRLAGDYNPFYSPIRFALSTLVVAFPILIYLSKLMFKELKSNEALRDWSVRRWLSYFTLFVAGVVVAGDLISLINTFLSGEISSRFVSKFAVVFIVAFAVFWYTVRDLRQIYFSKPNLLRIFTTVTSVVVIVSIIGGLFIVGLPQDQRKLRDDQTRIENLQNIQWQVVSHYQRTGAVPETLDELIDPLYPEVKDQFLDPESGQVYGYNKVASTSPAFEICADFALATDDNKGRGSYGGSMTYPYPAMDMDTSIGGFPMNESFEHTEGANCFTRTIDPKRYPIDTKPME